MNRRPQILSTQRVAQSRLFSIEQVDLEFSNGRRVRYERLAGDGPGAVLVVPVADDGRLLLVREYAVGVERYELGFVKGKLDEGETAAAAAQRELAEEIGFGAASLDLLRVVSLTPAYSDYLTHIFLARGLFRHVLAGDEPEPLVVVPWPTDRLDELLDRDDFSDARCQLAVFLARRRLAVGP
jgi:ADP-ribose diphosphatase